MTHTRIEVKAENSQASKYMICVCVCVPSAEAVNWSEKQWEGGGLTIITSIPLQLTQIKHLTRDMV